MEINNIVIGEHFKDFAQINIDFQTYPNIRTYYKSNIVFCKTDLIDFFFNEVKNFDINIILITHQSDYEIDQEKFSRRPRSIKKWFAQNVNFSHPDLIPLPIGLENHKGWSKGSFSDWNYIQNLENINKEKDLEKIYVNFGDTHSNRGNVRNFLSKNNLSYQDKSGLSYSNYMDNMSKFLFVASPRGNGIDCHRTWEALLLGCIPIVEKHFMYDNYNLPIIQIEKWEDLLDGSIQKLYIEKYKSGDLFQDLKCLTMDYWRNIIKSEYLKYV